MTDSRRTALIMAAGTGGHIYPGLAIASILEARGWRIVWLGTPTGMEHRLVGKAGYPVEVIAMRGVRGKGTLAWMLLPLRLLRAFWQAVRVLSRTQPDVVVSMGGYVAFPGGLMAVLLGKPLLVHEPGAHAGLVSRALALVADRVLVGFPHSFDETPKNWLARKLPKPTNLHWVGTPLRESITTLPAPVERMTQHVGPLRLLIVGGSLGAKSLNEWVVDALKTMPAAARPRVVHQSGEADFAALTERYRLAGVDATVLAFIDNMNEQYAWCDVILCRSGAVTVAELAACGVASILVPLPWFVNEEQDANARFLADAGAGILVRQTATSPAELAQVIGSMTRAKAIEMAQAAHRLGKPGAALACAEQCLELAA